VFPGVGICLHRRTSRDRSLILDRTTHRPRCAD